LVAQLVHLGNQGLNEGFGGGSLLRQGDALGDFLRGRSLLGSRLAGAERENQHERSAQQCQPKFAIFSVHLSCSLCIRIMLSFLPGSPAYGQPGRVFNEKPP